MTMAAFPTAAELEFSELESVFTDTKNPAAAWLAFHLATEHNLPVPEFAANEVARFAAEITEPLHSAWNGNRHAKLPGTIIARALGVEKGKEPAQRLRLARRVTSIVSDYVQRITNRVSPTTAVWDIAAEHGVTNKTIEEILTEARKTRDSEVPPF
jgi:hypothetical protein